MNPKYFIICTLDQLKSLMDCQNPLNYAYFNEMTILGEEDGRYEHLCEYRLVANEMDQEKRAARRMTARFNRKEM
jgi:hypothetical protein